MTLERPFFIGGFDGAPEQVWTRWLSAGLKRRAGRFTSAARKLPGEVEVTVAPAPGLLERAEADAGAAGFDTMPYRSTGRPLPHLDRLSAKPATRASRCQIGRGPRKRRIALTPSNAACDVLVLDGTGGHRRQAPCPSLRTAPDLGLHARCRSAILQAPSKREEEVDLVWFGGRALGNRRRQARSAMGADRHGPTGSPPALAVGRPRSPRMSQLRFRGRPRVRRGACNRGGRANLIKANMPGRPR